jgi:flagellin-like protein
MNRRAISPIVSVVLMFALIIAAIGISLVYMMPSITQFKDKSYNNSTNLYFIALDATIQDLIQNLPPKSSDFLYVQEEGSLQVVEDWTFGFVLKDLLGIQTSLVVQDNVTRIIHRSTAVEDFDEGEHRYIVGPQEQDYLFLNGSSTVYNDIAVLNASRARYEPAYLELALYYRYSLITEYVTAGSEEIYYMDIVNVKFVQEDLPVFFFDTQKYIDIRLTYVGTETQYLGEINYNTDMQGEITLVNQYRYRLYEYPIYFPANPAYLVHKVIANQINIIINVSFS